MSQTISNISEEKVDYIKQMLKNKLESLKTKCVKLSPEEQLAIRDGANSGLEELYHLSCLTTFKIMEILFRDTSVKYIAQGRTEYEDLTSELYIAIMKNIKNYDGIHSLVTFFNPIIKETFSTAKEKGKPIQESKYYSSNRNLVKRAKKDFEKMGFGRTPTPLDVKMFIKVYYGRDISEKIVAEVCENGFVYFESIDSMENDNCLSDIRMNPEYKIVKQEGIDEFYSTIEKLNPRNKVYLLEELNYHAIYGTAPSLTDMCKLIKPKYPDLNARGVERLKKSAYREFKSYYIKQKNRNALPLNKMVTLKNDILLVQADEDDALAAIDAHINYILPEKAQQVSLP